ncbi:MAG: hypothetical protein P8P71_03050 [Phycisphaerales bacterium]|nr:hypothetical protein [Phycisphaerales bacterium]
MRMFFAGRQNDLISRHRIHRIDAVPQSASPASVEWSAMSTSDAFDSGVVSTPEAGIR